MIKLLEELGSIKSEYPPELLQARRAAFLTQVNELTTAEPEEELSAGDQEIIHLLRALKSAPVEYPPHLMAARRSALLQQMGRAAAPSLWDTVRLSIHRIFQYQPTSRAFPVPGLLRTSLVIVSLILAAFLGALIFSRTEQVFQPSASQGIPSPTGASTGVSPTGTSETALLICNPEDAVPACPPGELNPKQDLANPGNGTAQPAVSKDGAYRAAYVNDGHQGASWISNSPDSWIKIDLGQVRTINTVSLQNGSSDPSGENTPGQFVIAVALSDMYADGDSSHDYVEYAQVFHSEQTGFSGKVSPAETIQTRFSPVQARYVKITFKEVGASIKEVGVFMVEPPVLSGQSTHTPGMTLTPIQAATLSPTTTATTVSTGTGLPTSTDTVLPADTPTPLPTNTLPPADTATPVPTDPLPTLAPPTVQPTSPASTDPIVVTGNGQTLTFTCNGNDAVVRGHENTVTLLGSCRSITVTGNGNRVFWQYGSPVITNRGRDNIIRQL